MDLPEDVAVTLGKGIGAYLRDAPANEIPASLRKFRSFRPQALTRHRNKLIDALEDDGFRNDIVEWLEDAPRLNKEVKRVLTIASLRENGWEEALVGSVTKKPPSRTEAERLNDSLQRERERSAKLKEELRSQREAFRDEMGAAKQRVAESHAEIRELKAHLRAAETQIKALKHEQERRERLADKEARALRRGSERATRAKQAADERVTALKREVAALNRQKGELERRLDDERARVARARRPADAPAVKRGPRKKLKAPAGLLEDTPETLRAWLSHKNVRMIVDGYNVGKAAAGFPDLELEAMRNRVVDEVAKIARQYSITAIVVFDGAEVSPGIARRTRGPVRIQYSNPGVIADDHIVDLVEGLSSDPIIVVTNDRELQDRVSRHHATVATSNQLLGLIR